MVMFWGDDVISQTAWYLHSGHRSDVILIAIYDVTNRVQSTAICKENIVFHDRKAAEASED